MFVCMYYTVYAMDDELNMHINCNSFAAIIFAVELKKVKEKKSYFFIIFAFFESFCDVPLP